MHGYRTGERIPEEDSKAMSVASNEWPEFFLPGVKVISCISTIWFLFCCFGMDVDTPLKLGMSS